MIGRPSDVSIAQWGGDDEHTQCGLHTPMSAFLTIRNVHLENYMHGNSAAICVCKHCKSSLFNLDS